MKTRIFYMVIALVLTVALAVPLVGPGTAVTADPVLKTQLAMILDGSGTINDTEWDTMINGLAAAVNSSECVPQDGSVELTVVQFATDARLEVGPVVIDDTDGDPTNDASAVAGQIASITKYPVGGFTCIACGICLAADVLRNHTDSQFTADLKQALNLVTDGEPNRCIDCGDCTEWECQETDCSETNAEASAEDARDYAISLLQMTTEQDEFDVEGIGITDTNRDWLKSNIIFPATGYSSPPESWPPPGPGWVRVVDTFQDFADTICEKFQIIVEPTGACCNPLTEICVDGVLAADCEEPLEWNEGESCADIVCEAPDCESDVDCNDGNVCTTDTCVGGVCVYTNNTESCDDGNACTTGDICADGTCGGGPPPDCDDLNVCTDDSCNPATGCVNTNNADACDDGDECTTVDTCAAGACVGGPPPDCDDGDVCTDDSCDPATGCVNTNNTEPCDDENACTTGDICADGACVGGPPPDCDDLNVCTDDSCDTETGCYYTNNAEPCDDENDCTTGDICAEGACVPGTPECTTDADCDDRNDDTNDTCNLATGCCQYVVEPPPLVTGVPTLSQWGMIAMGILFAAFLIWTVRRRWVVSAGGSQE